MRHVVSPLIKFIVRYISDQDNSPKTQPNLESNYLAREQLPDADAERPNVHLVVARLVPDDLRRHPGHGAGEGHARRLLPGPSAGGAEVADLDHLVLADQDADRE